jgi:hypothetical protein
MTMKRFYCPQWCHRTKGWIDIPMLASTQEKPVNDALKRFCEEHQVQGRVIRKPHGWSPEDSKYQAIDKEIT